MYVKVRLKHIIIPFIVLIITIVSLVGYNIKNVISNSFEVAYLYQNDDLVDHSEQAYIFNILNEVKQEVDKPTPINLESSELSNTSIQRWNKIVARNDLIIIDNLSITDVMSNSFNRYKEKTFILINEDYSSNLENVANIKINYNYIVKQAAMELVKTNENHQYLYVGVNNDNEQYTLFQKIIHKYDNKAIISELNIENAADNITIRNKMNDEFSKGFGSIYIADSIVSQIIIKTGLNYQNNLIKIENKNVEDKEKLKENIDKEKNGVNVKQRYEIFKHMHIITNTYNDISSGLYVDLNENGIKDEENDKSIVQASYTYNLHDTLKELINIIIKDKKLIQPKELSINKESI